jgi:hypothetical protein
VRARPAGSPGYDALRRNADGFDLGGLSVLVASIDDLIAACARSAPGYRRPLRALRSWLPATAARAVAVTTGQHPAA